MYVLLKFSIGSMKTQKKITHLNNTTNYPLQKVLMTIFPVVIDQFHA